MPALQVLLIQFKMFSLAAWVLKKPEELSVSCERVWPWTFYHNRSARNCCICCEEEKSWEGKEWVDFQGGSLSAFRNNLSFLHYAKKCVSPVQLYVQINGRQTAWPSWSILRGMGRRQKKSKKGGVVVVVVRVKERGWERERTWGLWEWSLLLSKGAAAVQFNPLDVFLLHVFIHVGICVCVHFNLSVCA